MAAGTSRKISAASARAHTRKPKPKAPSKFAGIFKKLLLICFVGFLAWAYQATRPPPLKRCGSTDGPPITAPRVQLKDGRYLAYKEFGVPKDKAKHKLVFVHGFGCCRHDVTSLTASLSPDIVESKRIYIVSFDRPGYGESDPDTTPSFKNMAFDIQELADQLELGSKFYVIGFSMGGQIVWSCLKYIPHRLAGAALIAPVINYWWSGLPSNLSAEAFKQQLPQDQWALRVAHHTPWLNYWWNTQKLFPGLSLLFGDPRVLSQQDAELRSRVLSLREGHLAQITQQGFHAIYRDLAIGFGTWEFDPTDLKNPFPESERPNVHLWQGDEDRLVPVELQRYIARQLPWIQYHELPGAGHYFPYSDGVPDSIIQALLP
ncbi:hypothetical protein Salat_1017400 [Sesamum alatum]|uniref:AB hydrolase-1 domain-containing protein n=1 Tax=Sesamum alatum TaxID=300844 RepID=A0AAE1YM41_9LAMI|nr:hypothetical protein Salat_1017400 [Sesamum alatum]